jgi:type II secretion system protein N
MSTAVTEEGTQATAETRAKRILRHSKWVALGLGSLLFFSILKLPEARLKAYLQGVIASQLAAQGITFTASNSSISILFGLKYRLEGVTLTFPPPAQPVKLDEVAVSPSLLKLVTGKFGGSIVIEQGDTEIDGTFAAKVAGNALSYFSVDLDLEKANIGRLGLLAAAGLQGTGLIDGSVDVTLDWSDLKASKGTVSLKISKAAIDAQSIYGFSIPRLTFTDGKIEAEVQGETVRIKELKLGKPGSTDDLVASVTGTATLNRVVMSSVVDLTANLIVSENLNKSFSLIGALLAPGKQKDGSYTYKLTGNLSAPFPTPVPAQ